MNPKYTGVAYDGTGVTIGVVGVSDFTASDITRYRTAFLPSVYSANTPHVIIAGNDPGFNAAGGEALLDLEIAGGIAPGARINYYMSGDTSIQNGLNLSILRALDDNLVSILSVSFGACEADLIASDGNTQILHFWEQAAAQGISVTVASGDSGPAGCDNPDTQTLAVRGYNVSGYASTPYNIAVGGTDFSSLYQNLNKYVRSTNSAAKFYQTALSYIPEYPWNNSTTTFGGHAGENIPNLSSPSIAAGGGGESGCLRLTSSKLCTGGYPTPYFQGYYFHPYRQIPDVSLLAGSGYRGASWLICADSKSAPQLGPSLFTDCQLTNGQITGNTTFSGIGGTSASAPAFAAMLALVSQSQGGARLGQADYALSRLTSAALYPKVFHDITTGNNAVACQVGTSACSANGFLFGFGAVPRSDGDDATTGWGSVDVAQLVANWNAATFSPTTTTLQVAGFTVGNSAPQGTKLTLSGSVASTGGPAPTGYLDFTNGAGQVGIGTLSGSVASVTTAALPVGSYTFYAHFPGDISNAPSVSNGVPVNITAAGSSTFSIAGSAFRVAAGATTANTSNVTVAPAGGFTGTVSLSCAITSAPTGATSLPGCTLNPASVSISGAQAGTSTLSISTTPSTTGGSYVIIVTGTSGSTSVAGSINLTVSSPTVGLQFIPVAPCRVADTRNAAGPLGGPELAARMTREFDIPVSNCKIPSNAVAYSLNVTAVPIATLNYLTAWPSGTSQPLVSTLNSDGRIKANAAIIPAGSNGGVSVYVTDATHIILDINGYFVPAGTVSALAFYPVQPCRFVDTRNAVGPLGGPSLAGGTSRYFPVGLSDCNSIPSTAKAYSLNITAVPHKPLGYLTAWGGQLAAGQNPPYVSTLNASTGAVTANAAIVLAGSELITSTSIYGTTYKTVGETSIFASDDADVIIDVNGYFAPPTTGGLSLYTTTPCRIVDTRLGSGAFNGALKVAIGGSACSAPSTAQAFVLNTTVVPSGSLNYLTVGRMEIYNQTSPL